VYLLFAIKYICYILQYIPLIIDFRKSSIENSFLLNKSKDNVNNNISISFINRIYYFIRENLQKKI